MLKYPKVIFTSLVVLAVLAATDYFTDMHFMFYMLAVMVPAGILAWGSGNVCSGMYLDAHCKAKNKGRVLALTFDDGPDEESTPRILDILRENNIAATFFCTGANAEKSPEIIKRINDEGHIIGNHSYSHHFFFDLFRQKKMEEDVGKSDSVIFRITGKKMKFFRPPYGVTNPVLARVVKKSGYEVVGWSLRSKDTVIDSDEKLLRRIERKMQAGDLVLLHDRRHKTAETLRELIRIADGKNYRFERADRILNIEAYE